MEMKDGVIHRILRYHRSTKISSERLKSYSKFTGLSFQREGSVRNFSVFVSLPILLD